MCVIYASDICYEMLCIRLLINKFLPLDLIQFEMLKRGFIAVNVGYDSSLIEYASSPGMCIICYCYVFLYTYDGCSNVL